MKKAVLVMGLLILTGLQGAILSLMADEAPPTSIETSCGFFGLCGKCRCSGLNCTGGNGTLCWWGTAWCQCSSPQGTSSCTLPCKGAEQQN